ncbi:hypothetical protein L4C34_02770 [Vibrio profundum]|uniref:hypothetical protein n=1 Tax=Vibrio profundum TaxID=2910247 RepID=UPI003D0D3963
MADGMRAHGSWTMCFENQIFRSKVDGSTNKETAEQWFEELKSLILASERNISEPWVALIDVQSWNMASLDSWEHISYITDWMHEHNCILFCYVFSKEIQKFAIEKGIKSDGFMQFFFDCDEACEACVETLADNKAS